ncbi:hypothetical protein [Brachybacterium sp. UNK5269]|uniref:hypothetical protein n=1 Tax=Brachybacterium sp. UNK5269 TaxID=3408576 RepID=UPI003BB1668B
MKRSRQPPEPGRTIATGWTDSDPSEVGARAQSETGAHATPSADRESAPRPLLVIGAIVAILALVLLVPPLLIGGHSARDVAENFLQAVVDGDTTTVREHLGDGDGALDIALVDEVVDGASHRVERFSIDSVELTGSSARVVATLVSPVDSLETTLDLQRHNGGFLRLRWELVPVTLPTLRLQVPVGSSEVEVNGQVLEIPERSRPLEAFGLGSLTLRVLPGTYVLHAQELSSAVVTRTARVTLPPVLDEWTSAPVAVSLDLTEAGEEEARRQLNTALEECIKSVFPQPESCPFAAPEDVTEEGTWSIESPPLLTGLSGGQEGVFEFAGTLTVAEFTIPAGTGAGRATVHTIEAYGGALAVVDRDGRVHAQWTLHHAVDADPSAAQGDS